MYIELLIMLILQANGVIIPNYCWWILGIVFVLKCIDNILKKSKKEE